MHHVFVLAGEDDLRDVRLAVADLAARWKDLGISLGIFLSELNTILSSHPHSPSDCLRDACNMAEAKLQCKDHFHTAPIHKVE